MKKLIILALMLCLSTMVFAQTFNIQPSGTTNHLLGIDFLDDDNGYVVGMLGTIRRTSDGGQTWTDQSMNINPPLYTVDFTDINTGFAGGDEMTFIKTIDGGTNWVIEAIPNSIFPNNTNLAEFNIRRIVALDANNVYVTVAAASGFPSHGFILKRTVNAGNTTWSLLQNSPESMYGLFVFPDNNNMTIWTSGMGGVIFKSVDDGINWTPYTPLGVGTTNVLQAIHVVRNVTPNAIVCTGATSIGLPSDGVILRSVDNGSNWTNISAGNQAFLGQYLTDLAFRPNLQIGYAVGGNNGNIGGNANAIFRTDDAGLTWTRDNTSPNTSRLYRLSLPSCNAGYICGLDGTVLKSTQSISVQVSPQDTTITMGASVDLSVTGNSVAATYQWQPAATLSTSNTQTVTATPNTQTYYTVTVTDAAGCTATSSAIVRLEGDCSLKIPNAFTPNGDDSNDEFRLLLSSQYTVLEEFAVFDRWGAKIFSTNNIQDSWDGKLKDKECPTDVYIYYVKYHCPTDNKSILLCGDVTLIR